MDIIKVLVDDLSVVISIDFGVVDAVLLFNNLLVVVIVAGDVFVGGPSDDVDVVIFASGLFIDVVVMIFVNGLLLIIDAVVLN